MLVLGQAVAQDLGYYQTPALGPGSLVFASEGDLWCAAPKAKMTGGRGDIHAGKSIKSASRRLGRARVRSSLDLSCL